MARRSVRRIAAVSSPAAPAPEPQLRSGVAALATRSPLGIVRASLPRMLVSALGPIGTFVLCLRLSGCPRPSRWPRSSGSACTYERRRGRPGVITDLLIAVLCAATCRTITFVWAAFYLVRAVVGLAILSSGRLEVSSS